MKRRSYELAWGVALGALATGDVAWAMGEGPPPEQPGLPDASGAPTPGEQEQRAEPQAPKSPLTDKSEPAAKAPSSPAVQSDTSSAKSLRDNPHTTFELGIGGMALPAAEVCPTSPEQCEQGEVSFALSLQNLYHISSFAFGAGIIWAFGLRSDIAAGDDDGSLGREHSRSYFLVEGQFRYYFAQLTSWEFWTGATVGTVIVRDSWDTLADREPYFDTETVGPRAQTMSTEGLAVGLGVGFQWNFTEWGIFGSRFRYANWILPDERELAPTGDPVSLAGRIDVFDLGLSLAARLDI